MPLHNYFFHLCVVLAFQAHLALNIVSEALVNKLGLHMDGPFHIITIIKQRESDFLISGHQGPSNSNKDKIR
jgi:hypothetical protein